MQAESETMSSRNVGQVRFTAPFVSVLSPKYEVCCCDQNGPPARREEGAYLNRYVTDEQRRRRPIFIAPLWAGASWLFFRVARSTRITQIWALRSRLEKQPIDLRQHTSYFGDRALAALVAGLLLLTPTSSEARVYVRIAPPVPIVETVPLLPGPGYYWLPGSWVWVGDHYVWHHGYYALRPFPSAVWVEGHWSHHPHGWYWTHGHWRH
jgi:hypothetical protein